jgi:hypothetical protein
LPNPHFPLLAYPQFLEPLTETVIRDLFKPTADEVRWVWQTSNAPEARLGLLCLLKTYPHLGRFPRPRDIPAAVVEFLAKHAGLPVSSLEHYPKRTLLRHQIEVRQYLGVTAWSDVAAAVATETMQRLVGGRAHFSDLINGAIEALIAARFELPALSTLRRLAGHVAYREDSPENRTFNRSCHVGDGRGGDLLQSRAGYKQVSVAWTSRNTARGLSTPGCQNL